jgi:hypothetical protein
MWRYQMLGILPDCDTMHKEHIHTQIAPEIQTYNMKVVENIEMKLSVNKL